MTKARPAEAELPADALARALEFQRNTYQLTAGHVRRIDRGWAIRHPSLDLVWSLNAVHLSEPVDYATALSLAEEHLGDLPYRHLVIEHEPSGRRLEDMFRADGWDVERDLMMMLSRRTDREVDTGAAVEADEDEALALMRRWIAEDPGVTVSAEGLRQVVESNRTSWRLRDARRLGILGQRGDLAAITMLYSDGVVGQIEDVYTVPEERGRGHARALVTHATELSRAAGHELTFIVADDNGWPKHLYARIGFEPAARAWRFHQERARAGRRLRAPGRTSGRG